MEFTTASEMEIAVRYDAKALARLLELPVLKRWPAMAAMNGIEKATPRLAFLKQIHEQGDGFRVGNDDPRHAEGLARLVQADAWGQLRLQMGKAWDRIRAASPGLQHPVTVRVTLTLGNPDDALFVDRTLGYYGMGAVPGTVWLVCWPTEFNLSRIGACGVHELVHNIRASNVEGFSLAEWIVQEGVAEELTAEVCGPDSTGAWYAGVTGDVLEETWRKVVGPSEPAARSRTGRPMSSAISRPSAPAGSPRASPTWAATRSAAGSCRAISPRAASAPRRRSSGRRRRYWRAPASEGICFRPQNA